MKSERYKNMSNYKPLDVLKVKYLELYDWLKEISRYHNVEDFILLDYKYDRMCVSCYTKENIYNIIARLPEKGSKKMLETNKVLPTDYPTEGFKEDDGGYLGCTVLTRKPRAGEDWNRGRDLSDGKYCYETWQEIKNDIITYELVKVVKKQKEVAEKN